MHIYDLKTIGKNFRTFRKKLGMTQAEVAEASNLSDRAYADIERGISNARLETFLKICEVLQVSPNDVLLSSSDTVFFEKAEDIMAKLAACSPKEQKTAMELLYVYLNSLE